MKDTCEHVFPPNVQGNGYTTLERGRAVTRTVVCMLCGKRHDYDLLKDPGQSFPRMWGIGPNGTSR